jgi:hypothetical protein
MKYVGFLPNFDIEAAIDAKQAETEAALANLTDERELRAMSNGHFFIDGSDKYYRTLARALRETLRDLEAMR